MTMTDATARRTATCPLPGRAVVDTYFMEHRAKLLDIAAYLDRVERASNANEGLDDFRHRALLDGIAILLDGRPERARRVLELMSDHTTEPIDSAAGLKGAHGACPPDAGKEG